MEKTVALYLRVSTKHQDTPEGSLISQEQRLIEWYDYHNSQAKHSKEKDPYSNYVIYKDVETGTRASKRPRLKNKLNLNKRLICPKMKSYQLFLRLEN